MRITVLGSSHAVPGRDRLCTAFLLESGEKKYLVDGGAPVTSLLIARGMTPEDIDAVFVTHTHGDHVNGLVEMIDLESWHYTDAHTRFLFPEENIIGILRAYVRAVYGGEPPAQAALESYAEGVIWDDGTLRLTAIRSRHRPEPRRTYSFLAEAEGRRVLFTGDLSRSFEDFPAPDGPLDLVFCEAAHCRLEDAGEYLARAHTKRMVFHHIGPRNAELRPQKLPFPSEYARDGSVYEV